MKKLATVGLLAIGVLGSAPAGAQVYGQFTGAEALPVNGRMFGGYIHSSTNVAGVLGQLRLSFYPGVDFGFIGGLSRVDFAGGNRTTVRLGSDFKVRVYAQGDSFPAAIAIGGAIGIESGDSFHVLSLGPTVVASRKFSLGQSSALVPYAGVTLQFSNIDTGARSESDFSMPLRIGSNFVLGPQLNLDLEIHINLGDNFNDDIELAAGVNVPF